MLLTEAKWKKRIIEKKRNSDDLYGKMILLYFLLEYATVDELVEMTIAYWKSRELNPDIEIAQA